MNLMENELIPAYVNNAGIVIRALQWDGSQQSADRMGELFDVQAVPWGEATCYAQEYLRLFTEEDRHLAAVAKNGYVFPGLLRRFDSAGAEEFEAIFKPI